MAGLQYAGEFTLDQAFITTSNGDVINLRGSITEINIFEDIFKNNIHGNILLFDTQNFFSKSYIRGQDTIYLEITTPSISDRPEMAIKQHFFVHSIDLMEEASAKSMAYQLSFTTKEHFTNERKKISKGYQDSPTKIIESILKAELETKKPILVEASKNIKRVVFANKKPFDAIRQIMQEAVSKINDSPSYLFYETTKGFYCTTMTNLYQQEPVTDFNAGEVSMLDGDGQAKHINPVKDFERVIEMSLKPNIDSLINTAIGVLASKSTRVNLFNKSVETNNYKYFDEFNRYDRSEGKEKDNPIYNDDIIDNNGNTIGDFVDAKTHLHTVIENDGKDTSHYNTNTATYSFSPTELGTNTFLTRSANRKMADNMIELRAHVNGHVGLEVGQTCTIQEPMKDDSGKSVYQGKYLITQLRHSFNVADMKHEITMSMTKDSTPNVIEKRGSINFNEYANEKSGGIVYVENIE